jgi:toxin ParE1/3/4
VRSLDLRPAARTDLIAIQDFIAADDPRRAVTFAAEIRARCEVLTTHPDIGRARDDLLPGLRILPIMRRAAIAYLTRPDRIEILRIFYAGQDYETILREAGDA